MVPISGVPIPSSGSVRGLVHHDTNYVQMLAVVSPQNKKSRAGNGSRRVQLPKRVSAEPGSLYL